MKRIVVAANTDVAPVELGIARDKIDNIIGLARRFDVKEEDSDPDSGSNATDDDMRDVLENQNNDPVVIELRQFIRDMDIDEQSSLVALAWIGRGTYVVTEWEDALAEARGAHNNHTAEYLMGLPLLADYLEGGLDALDGLKGASPLSGKSVTAAAKKKR